MKNENKGQDKKKISKEEAKELLKIKKTTILSFVFKNGKERTGKD